MHERVDGDISQTGLRRTPEFRKSGVRGSEKRKCVMTEEFYWPSYIYHVRITTRVVQFDANHSVTESTQSIAASVQKFPDSVVRSVSTASHTPSMYQVKRSAYRSV